MDEKLKQTLDALLDKLSDAQKEQAKSCKTPDELTEFLGTVGVELPDELLDAVSGGYYVRSLGAYRRPDGSFLCWDGKNWVHMQEPPRNDPVIGTPDTSVEMNDICGVPVEEGLV